MRVYSQRPLAVMTVLTLCTSTQFVQATVPQSIGGMEHAEVFWDVQTESLSVVNTAPTLVMLNHGESYAPPADVLDGKGYNNQPGFLKGQAFAPPVGTEIWVEVLAISPGLETYEGGMRAMAANHTYAPILSSVGERWKWNGSMHHPWYAAAAFGDYSVDYRVYIGEASTGAPLAQYGADTTTFDLVYAPEPSGLVLMLAGCALAVRRKVTR
jgi:hypothetical protein